jgi:hypothetical protein
MSARDCQRIIDRLDAFVDGELPGAERLRVAQHLTECGACELEADDRRNLGELLRAEAPKVDTSTLRGLPAGIVSRITAEQQHSWRTRLQTAFEDWHWLMIGTGSLLGTATCTLLVGSVLLFGPTPERSDSLAARMNTDESAGTLFVVATPVGDNKSSMVMQFEGAGAAENQASAPVVPSSIDVADESAMANSLADVVTHDGHLVDLSSLSQSDRLKAEGLLDDIRRLRVPDRRYSGGGPVTVHSMWLVAYASVSAKAL